MPEDKGPVRPQQVTVAGLAVIAGSLVLLLAAFDQISTLHSLDTRKAVERLIGDQPNGLGITVTGWLRILKVVGMVTGACAAAAAILGWQALQRSRAARVVLSVVAAPMVLAGLAIEPLFAIVVAIAVITLWLPIASAWFDGREPAPVVRERPPSGSPSGPPSGPPVDLPAPPPYVPPAGTASPYASYPPPQQPSPYPPYGAPVPVSAAGPRPRAVTVAAVVTFVLAGLVGVLGIVLAVVGGTMAGEMLDELQARGYDTSRFTADELGLGFAFLGVLVAIASLVAVVAAFFVLRRSSAARVVLTVMAGLCMTLSLLGIASGGSVITLVGAVVVLVLLYRRASSAWFRGR